MVANFAKAGSVFKSVLLGASMLTMGAVAAAQAAQPTAAPIPAPVAAVSPAVPAPADKLAPAPAATDKVAKVADQHRLSAAADAAFEKIKSLTATHKESLTKDGQALLTAVDNEIASLKKKYEAASGEAKEQWGKQAAALKVSRDKLAAQVDALGLAKPEAWDAARKAVEGAYSDLSSSVAAAMGKLKV